METIVIYSVVMMNKVTQELAGDFEVRRASLIDARDYVRIAPRLILDLEYCIRKTTIEYIS
jgi:hypothetical protein